MGEDLRYAQKSSWSKHIYEGSEYQPLNKGHEAMSNAIINTTFQTRRK